MNLKKRDRKIDILLSDIRFVYLKLENDLQRFAKETGGFNNHLVSLGNEGRPSARYWRFIMTLYYDAKGNQRIKIKYFFPDFHAYRCHTKNMRLQTTLYGVKRYVTEMAIARFDENNMYYRAKKKQKKKGGTK